MDQTLNPYSPGAGRPPKALAGRDEELALVDTMAKRVRYGLSNRGVILQGLRGVGKTVLLNELAVKAEEAGWLVVQIEAAADEAGAARVRAKLARELAIQARKLKVKGLWSRIGAVLPTIASFSLSLGVQGIAFEAEPRRGRADSGDISIDLEEMVVDVAEAAAADGKALAFFIDEMQDLDADLLSAVITAQHLAGQRELPFYVFGAGLPTLPQVLADSQSYAERLFEYREVGPLTREAAAAALEEPARRFNVGYRPEALAILLDDAGNYPYFLQEFGSAVWRVSPQSPVTAADARLAVEEGKAALDVGFFPSRWDRATPAEKQFLGAMAEISGDDKPVAQIAEHQHKTVGSVSGSRKRLIVKGLIYSPAHGILRFTVPGMEGFIARNADDVSGEP